MAKATISLVFWPVRIFSQISQNNGHDQSVHELQHLSTRLFAHFRSKAYFFIKHSEQKFLHFLAFAFRRRSRDDAKVGADARVAAAAAVGRPRHRVERQKRGDHQRRVQESHSAAQKEAFKRADDAS